MKIFKKLLILFIFPIFFLSFTFQTVWADDNYVYLGGDSIGVKFDTGVMITGKFEVTTKTGKVKPWKNSDIKNGDQILAYNNQIVNNNQTLLRYLRGTTDEEVVLTIKRKKTEFNTTIKMVETINEEKSLGLYVKDQMIGIGTLTYVDPMTNYFASLGHGVYGENLEIGNVDGTLVYSSVEAVKKGMPGTPGEKRATLNNEVIGVISYNDISGVYGMVSKAYLPTSKIKLGNPEGAKKGKAKIYTALSQNEIKAYDVLITDVNHQETKENKGLKIKVIDQNLIKKSGGIIQGMSGSPIVQNGKIVGAVSHVSVNNPLVGYGVYVLWMQEEINRLAKERLTFSEN